MTKMWKMMLIVCCIASMIVSTSTMAVLAGELEEGLIESEAVAPDHITDLEDSLDEECLSLCEHVAAQYDENETIVGASAGNKVTATLNFGVVVLNSDDGTLSRQWISKAGFDKNEIKSIRVGSGTVHLPADSSFMFAGCNNLEKADLRNFETSNVTDMESMFAGCSNLKELDLSSFDTSNVTNMGGLFANCSSLTELDVSMFDTSKVTQMSNMFQVCSGLKELNFNNFDTSHVTHMMYTFYECSGLEELDFSNFSTSQVKSMNSMFEGCTNLKNLIGIEDFDVTRVSEMNYMFKDCSSITKLDLDNFQPSALIGLKGMFENCSSLIDLHLSNLDMSKIVDNNYDDAFKGCSALYNIWIPQNNKRFIRLPAVFYDELKKEYRNLPYDSESILLTRDYFSTKREEHNSYQNDVKDFYTSEEIAAQKSTFQTSEEFRLRLTADLNPVEKQRIIDRINGEFNGACLGANASMVLKNLGKIIIAKGSYYDLGKPKENNRLRDIINYYHIYQFRDDFIADYKTIRGLGHLNGNLPKAEVGNLQEFLTKFIAEAQRSQNERKPFIFNYDYRSHLWENTHGHSVIVCGFDQEDYDSDDNLEYKIKIYDLNITGAYKPEDDYIYMYVEKDCSAFHFQDMKNKREDTGIYLENTWQDMSYIGIDNLESRPYYKLDISDYHSGITDISTGYVSLLVDAGVPFVLTNAQGKTFSYDGSYSGNLDIYSMEMICNETPSLKLLVSPSESFKVEGIDGNFAISVEMDGHYYRTSTNGADEILFSKDEGIVLDGQGAYSFEAALDADIKDYSLVEISSSASGKVKIINPDDSITLDSELPCQDIAVNYMNIDGGTRDVIEEEQDHLNIFEENNKIKYGDGINIASATVTGIESAYQYSGKEIKPDTMVMLEGKVLIKDTDYSVEYLNNVNPGTAAVKVIGRGAYEGSKTVKFVIEKKAVKGFTDVQNPTHPYYKAIYWAADAGITKGYPDGTFGIDNPCTRGEMMMFLWRYAGKPAPKNVSKSPFKDVPKTHTFYKAILWGSQKGITKGYADGTFGINRNVSRGECMMFLWRLKGKPSPKAVEKSPFKDVSKTHVFYNAILWGAQKKITTGYTSGVKKGTFGINENCTRGQIVTFLYRAK